MTIITTERPAGIGGIDLSGIDIAAAIFKATGGGYGSPGSSEPTASGEPSKLPDWFTNTGNGPVSDHFDFSKPPADRDTLIKYLAEPEGSHPLLDLFKGADQPDFANGGPEGAACVGPLLGAAVVLGVFLWAADDLSGGAICDALGWNHEGYADPDAVTGELQSPAEMFASLLGKAGITGIDPTSVGITDILGKLSDNMGKVADLVGALAGATQTGDTGAFGNALVDLMSIAGLDAAAFDFAAMSPSALQDAVFDAFGIVGGLEGAANLEALRDAGLIAGWSESTLIASELINTWGDIIV